MKGHKYMNILLPICLIVTVLYYQYSQSYLFGLFTLFFYTVGIMGLWFMDEILDRTKQR